MIKKDDFERIYAIFLFAQWEAEAKRQGILSLRLYLLDWVFGNPCGASNLS